LAVNVLFGGHRSFHCNGAACIGRLRPPLQALGEEYIPRCGPCIVTFNHYYRPGFNAWWMALAIAALVPLEMHWVMTGELTFPGKWYAPLGKAGSRWLLKRLAGVYGFTAMPPMPPRPQDVEARARAVRAVLSYVKDHPDAILGLAPEGGDNVPTGALAQPAPGAGRFISLLVSRGFGIAPAGVYEGDGALCLRFGEAYNLEVPPGLSANDKDVLVARMVMERIAVLLPARLRGEFII
jgi:hypothetical protein